MIFENDCGCIVDYEELEKAKFLMPPENEGHYADNVLFLDDAIKIVRKGGVE